MKTASGLVEYAKAQLGLPYWWGTFGNIASQSLLDYKKKQYPEEYNKAMYSDAYKQFGLRVHDCVGLIKGYRWSDTPTSKPSYVPSEDVNVTGMFLSCSRTGSTNSLPEIPGILLFTPELDHVGVYIGNKTAIEARGHLYGVVETNIITRTWKLWGMPNWLTYNEDEDIHVSGKMPELRKGDVGKAVVILQKLLNYHGECLEEDGEFGSKTEHAVKRWQKNIDSEINGICSEKEWISLVS